MLHLTLFGTLVIARHDGGRVAQRMDVLGRPGSLLAFLALARGRYFSRVELLSELWSDSHSDVSTGALNTTLWRLRKILLGVTISEHNLVVAQREGAVGMPADSALKLDVEEFEQLVAPVLAKPIERTEKQDVDRLCEGVRLYAADILAGFSDDWALRERERFRRHLLNALGRLMHMSTLARDFPSAITYAQTILDRDTLREDVHRELMRLFLANGQRSLALRQFELCREALRRELAIQPMRETVALYQQIADSAVRIDHVVPPKGSSVMLETSEITASDVTLNTNTRQVLSPRILIQVALHHQAAADANLQQTLPMFDSDPG